MSLVSDTQIEHFATEGYVVVDGLLSDTKLDQYSQAVDQGIAKRTRWDTRALTERSRYEQSFRQCLNLWEDIEAVRELTFHRGVAEAAAALLGTATLRLWHDQALYKEAGGRQTDAHLDHEYWAIQEPRTITAWIPLEGSTLANGAMGYIPGSHLFEVTSFANIFTGTGFDIEQGDEARGLQPNYVEVPRGSVAFHHGRTIHLAKPNITEQTRKVHTMIYFADGCTRRGDRNHLCVDREHIPEGAPIRGLVTPIVWPREPGQMPPVPPAIDPPSPGWPGWPD